MVLSLFAAGLAAGGIHAGPPLATTTTTTTETTTTTATDVTTTVTATAPVTTAATTTVATTTAATTTAPAPRPKSKPAGKLLTATPLAAPRCLLVAGFALLQPGRRPLALGSVAVVPHRPSAADSGVAYPADGSVLTASSVGLSGSGCGTAARARAVVGSVSLFGGAATIRSVELSVRNGIAGKTAAVTGVTVGKTVVAALPGRPIVIGPWGYVVALAQPDATQAGALAVHLTKAHAGLAAGTVILIGYAQLAPSKVIPQEMTTATAQRAKVTTSAAPPARKVGPHREASAAPDQDASREEAEAPRPQAPPRRRPADGDAAARPLELRVPGRRRRELRRHVRRLPRRRPRELAPRRRHLRGARNAGRRRRRRHAQPRRLAASRRLAPVGARPQPQPVLLRAPLGYSPLALNSKYVKKGDVIGFIGNSGDAFTTPPHLHFEIHPHQLLKLDYNGAVNPTPYIDGWRHLTKPKAPLPVHPPFPAGPVRREASYIWRELLAARGLTDKAPKPSERPRVAVPHGDLESSPRRLAAAKRREAASTAVGHGSTARDARAGPARRHRAAGPALRRRTDVPPAARAPVIVSLHVATGAALGALSGSRVAAALLGPPAHLLGDRIPHQDIASRRFEIGSGAACLALLAVRRGPLDSAVIGAAAASAPDLEHVFRAVAAGRPEALPRAPRLAPRGRNPARGRPTRPRGGDRGLPARASSLTVTRGWRRERRGTGRGSRSGRSA